MIGSLHKTLIFSGAFTAFCILASAAPARAAIVPEYQLTFSPGPSVSQGDSASISIVPKNFNAASTTFSWYKISDNTLLSSGLGKSTYSFRAPNILGLYALRVTIDAGPEYTVKEDGGGFIIMPPGSGGSGFGGYDIGKISANFSLLALPKTPRAGDRVTVSATSFAFNTRNATFSWYLDGVYKSADSGAGRSDFLFTAGKTGSVHTVRADVLLPDGAKNSKSVEARVLSTNFYWWSNSHAPYWYKGKALPTGGSRIGVMLLSDGNTKGLYPRWSLFDEIDEKQKTNVFVYAARLSGLRDNVSVELIDSSEKTLITSNIAIVPQSPRVKVYALHPLEGVLYNESVGTSFVGSGASSIDLAAEPFYFDEASYPALEYSWSANYEKLTPEKNTRPEVLTITSDGPSQNFPVSLEVNDARNRSSARANFQFRSQ